MQYTFIKVNSGAKEDMALLNPEIYTRPRELVIHIAFTRIVTSVRA